MKKLIITATALLAGTAALAQTAPVAPEAPAPTVRPLVTKTFTRAETVALVREHFGRMDADRNGSITREEATAGRMKGMRAMHGEGGAPHMAMRDGPMGDPNAAFDRLDANKDGSISRDEFAKAREQRIEKRMVKREGIEGGAPKDGKEVRRQMRRMHGGGGFGARMIVMADTNRDGQITLAEAEAMALQHFDQMDLNKDGQVTPEERRAGRPMIIKRMVEEPKGDS